MTRETRNPRKGGITVAVLVISTSMAVVLAAVLSHSLTERKLNKRHELRLISKNASEALVEYGFAQLKHKFENQTNFTSDALAPGGPDEVAMPSSNEFGPYFDSSESIIFGGVVDDFGSTLTYIDPANPANEFDPLRGQKVYARNIALYAKATVNDPRGGPNITSYVTQKLQVRDSPLFAHAIFYNLDLEVSPGPKMEIHGPVHTNGDFYVQGIAGVDFHYPVSTAKDLLWGWGTDEGSAQGSGWENLQRGHIRFKNRNDDLVTMKVSGSFPDSTKSDWRTYSSEKWNGNVLTQDHGVEVYKPAAFADYESDDPSTPSYDPVNSGHQLIEPPLSIYDSDYNETIEEQKMSTKAGLYIKWDVETGTVTAYSRSGTQYDISDLEGSGSDYLYEIKNNAFYDHRRYQWIDTLELNMGKLKQLIEAPDFSSDETYIQPYYSPTDTSAPAKNSTDWYNAAYDPASLWNGIVYVETETSSSDSNDQARLNYSGVRLWGGETDQTGQGIPSRGSDPGMTLATNNALYVRGHFNADGVMHNSASSYNSATVPEVGEVPVSLYGDSITIQSVNWNDAVTSKKPTAASTEVAAAIVSGLIPSNAANNGRSSGGVHNFPRFLEKWSGKSLYIRGSLVCLYESEVDDSAWRIDYYGAPARNWGFSEQFLSGTFPPGTPLLRTYRRVNYKSLSASEFQAAIDDLPWNSGL
ncbi:hypothetical protein [Pelagicoccus albus]|uniref:Uncharacterized protein n=1 Tax=Pelagicoccus albus TaxID=415222 RepID=A0A7X1B2W6_9BACT|nr:hypothetical protein [Pelagicoccus albus]MBC2604661.1 hypothetical protein [Pelagicoccus albus]